MRFPGMVPIDHGRVPGAMHRPNSASPSDMQPSLMGQMHGAASHPLPQFRRLNPIQGGMIPTGMQGHMAPEPMSLHRIDSSGALSLIYFHSWAQRCMYLHTSEWRHFDMPLRFRINFAATCKSYLGLKLYKMSAFWKCLRLWWGVLSCFCKSVKQKPVLRYMRLSLSDTHCVQDNPYLGPTVFRIVQTCRDWAQQGVCLPHQPPP